METERLYTVPEVAEVLRTREETVRRLLRSGALRGMRLGGTRLGYRISEAALRDFIRERTEETNTKKAAAVRCNHAAA